MSDEQNITAKVTGNDPTGKPYEIDIPIPRSLPVADRSAFVEKYMVTAFTGQDQEFTPSNAPISREQRLKMLETPPASTVPGFTDMLQTEGGAGLSQVGQGLGDVGAAAMRAATGGEVNLEQLGQGGIDTAMGALRTANAVPMAVGAGLGKSALEQTGSPAVATAANLVGQIGTATGGTAAARAGFRAVAPMLPGASDALLKSGLQDVEGLSSGMLEGRIPSKNLYDVVDQMNPTVASLPNLKKTAQDLRSNEEAMSKFGVDSKAIINTADTIEQTIKAGGGIPFQEARSVLRRLGQRIDDLRDPMRNSTGSSEELGAMKQLYAGLLKDLETRTPKGATALKAANAAAKREFAVGELDDVIGKGVRTMQGKPEEAINFGTMAENLKKEIRKNELFAGAFEPGELEKIQDTLSELAKLPVSAPRKGAGYGFGPGGLQASVGGVIGGAVGSYTGAGLGSGALVGGMSSIVASKAVSKLLTSDWGRGFLLKVVRNQPNMVMTPQGISLLSAASRAASQQSNDPTQP